MVHQPEGSVKFATTINYNKSPFFAARARFVGLPTAHRPLDGLRWLIRILAVAWKENVLLLDSERIPDAHPELFAAAVMGFWPRRIRPIVVLVGDMYQPHSGLRNAVEKLLIKLADKGIYRYAVRSSDELRLFPDTWGVSASKVRCCPYYFTVPDKPPDVSVPSSGDYIFAGGNSHRDYGPLLVAARHLPELRFVIATTRLKKNTDIPPNVTAGPVTHHEFMALLRSAAVVVVPLRQGLMRAAGQQIYLAAMWSGKPTVVSKAPAVRDHVTDGETGLIVDGSPESYERALRWVFDPAHQDKVTRMSAAAHKVVSEQYTFENHAFRLLEILDEAVQDASANFAQSRSKLKKEAS